MSIAPPKQITPSVAGTNTAGQVISFPHTYVTSNDIVVAITASGGAVTTYTGQTGFTVSGTAQNGSLGTQVYTSGSVTITAAVPTTSTIVVICDYPMDLSNDMMERFTNAGSPIDGPFSHSGWGFNQKLVAQQENYTGHPEATASNLP